MFLFFPQISQIDTDDSFYFPQIDTDDFLFPTDVTD